MGRAVGSTTLFPFFLSFSFFFLFGPFATRPCAALYFLLILIDYYQSFM
jgi:hypothetical protein